MFVNAWRNCVRTLTALICASLFLVATSSSEARAETIALYGKVVTLSIVSSSSDNYATYHGRVTHDPTGLAGVIYFWGGSNCSNFADIDDQMIGMLRDAIIHSRQIMLSYKLQGSNKCVTGVYY